MIKCSICEEYLEEQEHPITGEIFENKGHYAEPINNGRCCDRCNYTIVIPKRIKTLQDESQIMPCDSDDGSWVGR